MPTGMYKRTKKHKKLISLGGIGHIVTKETREKIGNANRGRKLGFVPSGAFKKGQAPWNKGIPRTEEVKQKISGSSSPNWKGGVTPLYKKIRKSVEYKLWRNAVFTRDGWRCMWCRKRGGRLNADHIKPFSKYPALRFVVNNGRTLCEPCHRKTDTWGFRIKRYETR